MDRGFVNDFIRRSKTCPFNNGGAKEDLFLHYCELIEQGEIDPPTTNSWVVVDNFYVNGKFVYEKDCSAAEWEEVKEKCIDFCNTDIGGIAIMNY